MESKVSWISLDEHSVAASSLKTQTDTIPQFEYIFAHIVHFPFSK